MAVHTIRAPGEILESKIKEKNLTQAQAADRIGITRQYLNGIINGKYPFTADLSLKLTDPLGTSPDYWNEVLKSYDSFLETETGQELRKTKDRESLLLELELQSARSLVDHQIESALQAGYLGIEPTLPSDRIQSSSIQLSVGMKACRYDLNGQPTMVGTKPGIVLKRGECVTLTTLEKLTLPSRLRAHVLGLSDLLAGKFLSYSGQNVYQFPLSNHLSVGLINQGPFEVKIAHGDPLLIIGFEFLNQEPSSAAL